MMLKWVRKTQHRVEVAFSQYAPTRGIAFILAMGLLAYGVWLLLPLDSFANPAYALMGDIATKQTWGAVFAFSGATLGYGVWTRSDEWIQRGSWLGFVLWTVVAVLGVISAPLTPVLIVRMTIALMHAWVYIQVRLHPYLVNGYVTMTDLAAYVQEIRVERLLKEELKKEENTNDYRE